MDKKMNNEELQSRREFMKKTAKGALPILGISLFGPTILSSCEKEEKSNGKCSCSNTCSGSCDGDCAGNCDGCSGSCYVTSCKYM